MKLSPEKIQKAVIIGSQVPRNSKRGISKDFAVLGIRLTALLHISTLELKTSIL